MRLLKAQQRIAKENLDQKIFLDGVAGTGKTTAAIERIKQLIREGVPADSILVIVPQAALAVPYREALRRSRVEMGGDLQTATLGSLAFQIVDLFWPLVADLPDVSFAQPFERPNFLSLELVQYYMTRHIEPQIEQNDYFNSVTISRNRLYTQIIDNLNKAALIGFDYQQIGHKLKSAWRGDVEQKYIYDDAQAVAEAFRQLCLQHNMLDFSLQLDLFRRLWDRNDAVRHYLTRQYRHLIVDNIEEDTPALHDLLYDWLPSCDSAVLIYDTDGGFRRFLGADPISAAQLRERCDMHITLTNHRVMSDDLKALQVGFAASLNLSVNERVPDDADLTRAIRYADNSRFHPQMIDWAADQIAALVHDQGVPPQEIVVMAPYFPDALRFALQARLDERDVSNRTHRPSRALREEPAVRTLLTLARLAHPDWPLPPPPAFDVAYALTAAIAEFDLVRARLLVDILYRSGRLLPFERIENTTIQERITFALANRYDELREWIDAYQQQDVQALDVFFSNLFGNLLSQPQFGFHEQYDAANAAANLIDSARSFRQTVSVIDPKLDTASEYIGMVERGVIANLYVRNWDREKQDSVLLVPAYTFLMTNQPVDYQVWLNVGSSGWTQRLYQPLTHPYVLSRQWNDGMQWTDDDEVRANQETLSYLVLGLIRRCRKQIYLGFSQFGEQGYEQRGALLTAIQRMLRQQRKEAGTDV